MWFLLKIITEKKELNWLKSQLLYGDKTGAKDPQQTLLIIEQWHQLKKNI